MGTLELDDYRAIDYDNNAKTLVGQFLTDAVPNVTSSEVSPTGSYYDLGNLGESVAPNIQRNAQGTRTTPTSGGPSRETPTQHNIGTPRGGSGNGGGGGTDSVQKNGNLRGSGKKEEDDDDDDDGTGPKDMTSKEVKLLVKDVPDEISAFRRWFYHMKSCVVAVCWDPEAGVIWISEVENDAISFVDLKTNFGSPMKRIDIRIFNQLLGALKGEKVARFALQIEVECEFCQGRQALRIVHRGMVQRGQRLAMASTTQIFALKCKDISKLEQVFSLSH